MSGLRGIATFAVVVMVVACTAPSTGGPDPMVEATRPTAAADPPDPTPTPTGTPAEPPSTPSAPTITSEPTPSPAAEVLGTFDVTSADEVSGIIASRLHDDLLWLLDDGPGTTAILGVQHDGALVVELTMEGVEGRDTEDLAIGPCGPGDPTHCIYVGDIGDNRAVRDRILVHRFPEPADLSVTSTPVSTAAFTYPTGPVDAEALLIDDDGIPLIITKELDLARVMVADAFADGELIEVGPLRIPPPSSPLLTTFVGLSITAADSTPAGDRVILRTYDHVVELTAPTPDAPLSSLARWPAQELPAPFEPQGEAVAYLADGRSYVTASEMVGTMSVIRR